MRRSRLSVSSRHVYAGGVAQEGPRRLFRREVPPQQTAYSLAALGAGRIAAGDCEGGITFHHLAAEGRCRVPTRLQLADAW